MRPRAPPFVVRRRRIACLPMVGGDVRDSLTHSARIRPAPPAGPSPILPPVDHGSMEFRQNARPRAKATSRRPLKTRGKSGMKNDRSFPFLPLAAAACPRPQAARHISISHLCPTCVGPSSLRTRIHSLPIIGRVQELLSQLSPRARSRSVGRLVSPCLPSAGLGGFRLLEKLCVGCQVREE